MFLNGVTSWYSNPSKSQNWDSLQDFFFLENARNIMTPVTNDLQFVQFLPAKFPQHIVLVH